MKRGKVAALPRLWSPVPVERGIEVGVFVEVLALEPPLPDWSLFFLDGDGAFR